MVSPNGRCGYPTSADTLARVKVLMLAPPGGGKGTQGVRIADELGVEHISSGDLLRAAVAEDTPIGREVAEHMAAGRLAPDAVVTRGRQAGARRLATATCSTASRATLAQTGGLDFDAVVYLDVPDDVTRERLLARGRADDTEAVIERRLRSTPPTPSRSSTTTATACWSRSTATGRRTRSPPSCSSGSSR